MIAAVDRSGPADSPMKEDRTSAPTSWRPDERDQEPSSFEELRESEKRFRILSELTNDYCYVARVRDGRLTAAWLTGAFTRITGYREDQLGDESLWTIVHEEDKPHVRVALSRVQRGENVVHEFRIVTHAGDTRWLREHMRAEREPTGELTVYGAARDVTERHLAQLEHENLEAQLRQSQKMDAVGQLAGGVAHDFNNLLTVILTHCGFLLQELPTQTQLHDDASDIQAAARRAAELTQRLLAFSRQQVLTPTVLDLNSVLRDLEPVLTSLVGEGIELEMTLHPGAVRLRADRAQLEQIVLNFVVNARDAMPHGGRLQIVTAQVDLGPDYARTHEEAKAGPHVALGVRDTGVGMNEEVLARVFEPFFTTKEQGKGTGLGLSTVYGIVKQSGGSIQVESRIGFGSTFEVFFPRVDEPERREPSVKPVGERSLHQETILVVEDEEGVRRGVQRILKHAGYTVLVAADPAQAIALLEDYPGPLDMLLTDVVMPMMTGVQLAERVLTMRPGIKVLYMSGHAREGLDTHQASEGGVEFLQKPFTRQAMLSKVAGVLGTD
jgi:two-component system cell cycle sensor histidine kinase/response regulator CckA